MMVVPIYRFFDRYAVIPEKPDLSFLQLIATAFSHLPYENVTKILKQARSNGSTKMRQTEEVLEDHLRWNTGGTCFSLCNTLERILHECGFHAFIAMADMHYGPNIHCAVIGELKGRRYLLDPGYLLHDPIPLPESELESVTQTPMNTIVVRKEESGCFSLYTWEKGQFKWRYRLRPWPVSRAEFEEHWMRSFSLNSMEQVMLSRINPAGRLYFRKGRLDLVNPTERKKQYVSASEIASVASVFGIPADLVRQANQILLARS